MPSEPGYSLRLYSLWLYRVRTMPSEPGVVFSLKMRMALFMRARSIALRTWVRGQGVGVRVRSSYAPGRSRYAPG